MKTYFSRMAKILVAGLNPAWQQVLSLSSLHLGEVNRASGSHAVASGKGMNAAKILARLGHQVSLLQVVGGVNGRRMLEACAARGILSPHVFTAGETRAAVTLMHDGGTTEVIEPFQVSEPGLAKRLLGRIPAGEAYDALLICGTIPAGMDESFYGALVRRVDCGTIIWDSVMGFTPGIIPKIAWLKVNAAEYRRLRPLLEASEAHPATLITDGPAKTKVRHSEAAGSYALPALEGLLNPIGAGDTVTALLADGLLRKLPADLAVRRALAGAMASCLSPLPAEWNAGDAERLEKEIAWER